MTDRFEERIRELTAPINGQLPRPWMTDMKNPQEADVFIVGMNQSRIYPADQIGHQRHTDALFNCNGENCRGLYDEVTGGNPSRTRRNIDRLTGRLNQQGVHRIVETDVTCYSTPRSADLRTQAHTDGAKRGEEIFRYILGEIAPKVLIVHGKAAGKKLAAVLGINPPEVPHEPDQVCDVLTEKHLVIPIPSLSPQVFNSLSPQVFNWYSSWADALWIILESESAINWLSNTPPESSSGP